MDRLLQMEGECWVSEEIGVPVAFSREAGDVDATIDVLKCDLDPTRRTAPATNCRDIDRMPRTQGILYLLVHAAVLSGSTTGVSFVNLPHSTPPRRTPISGFRRFATLHYTFLQASGLGGAGIEPDRTTHKPIAAPGTLHLAPRN
jgi:hypothetical protein